MPTAGGGTARLKAIKKAPFVRGLFTKKQGDVLLSHPVSEAVPSVLEGLTSVFGMGTGVSPPL
jgi:hypothetical protein